MQDFLNSCLPDLKGLKIEKLKGDGGHRSYTRLKKGSQSYMLMSCGANDPSLKLFIDIQMRLKKQVQVPQIFHFDLKNGFLLLEDLGDISLEHVFFNGEKEQKLFFYQQALKQLIELQSQVQLSEKDPVFDSDFFLAEMDQAVRDIEKYVSDILKKSFDKKLFQDFKEEIKQAISHFQREDYVYCHRDYHSRNLMIKNNKLVMIDFQDAGAGPWCYDLASLLYDCYVPLSNRKELVQFYFENLSSSLKQKVRSLDRVNQMLGIQFLQRGFKACGRFCAFKIEDNKETHLKYLKPTFALLKSRAEDLSYPAVSACAYFLIQALN